MRTRRWLMLALHCFILIPSVVHASPQFGLTFEDGLKPAYFIETVYSLYQDEAKQDTIFLQPRVNYSSVEKDYYNLGIGWRRYLEKPDALVGINMFGDLERENRHGRLGFGAEYLSRYVDLRTNLYLALTPRRRLESHGDYILYERALDGWDAEAGFPIPGIPTLKFFAGAEGYDYKHTDDSYAWRSRLEWTLSSLAVLDLKVYDDNHDKAHWSLEARFNYDLEGFSKWKQKLFKPVETRDIRDRALERVRRESRIRKERFAEGGLSFVVVKA